jgi:uncharacterized protein YneF (UPF0154 family)
VGIVPKREGRAQLQGLYGALLGGLMASFVAFAVFTALVGSEGIGAGDAVGPLVAVLVGVACAVVFMVGGLFTTEKAPWLGSALLFASGFTTLWTVVLSSVVEQRWVVLLALGVAIATGVVIGWFRFRREPEAGPAAGAEAAWTH